jgi:cytochrome oxidase assembly protein ShyY1
MLSLLRTRRWQGFTAVVVLAIVAFGLLSRWQWDRAEEKRLMQQAQEVSELQPITPALGQEVAEFTAITMTGTYRPDVRRLVRQRPMEGRNGFWVMDQLRGDHGRVWVLRGWVPAPARAGDSPEVDPVPSGLVTVTGYARPLPMGEPLGEDRGGLPIDQVTAVERAQLPDAGDMTWYLQLQQATPAETIMTVPITRPDDLQNISYAVQWLLFAMVAMAGWFYFLRREAKESQSGM